ncbi:cupredoxin domain-containing protein [Methylobacterium sp. E-066]|uniref:cupredoxin domain-containing protein n=1 Tax=Methylobacterium sp. E-066 TaxID=2836584 RepID=UPI001FBAEE22|nr:cupredoxin domain-containing protein [Methylobacterium sp. E-066]MCJ2141427.1 cupredoxin domain-containing protein [Methylobacterium sp. E-066]
MTAALATLLAGAASAEDNPQLGKPASAVMPPVELTVTLQDGKPVCAPADLRLPANTDVMLQVVSQANVPVTITAEGQFEQGHLLHADGDLVHVMSEKGYTVKANGHGTLKLRTLDAGEHSYACTANNMRDAPFVGKMTLSPPAG